MIESFITILAWFGLVIGAGVTVILIFNYYELNNTAHGKLRQNLAHCQGREIIPRSPAKWIVMFIVSLAWLIAAGF
jgi:hypothetical protein